MTRRALALILLGLALIVCVALAASESLTNRTGRTAAAVTVTFSEQVRITSYDETVFATKDPSSRSDTFRFSGGQLENGARFSVSWTPSTAEITSTKWEPTGAASSASTGSSAPLTYEQIMTQIAHYPGPEEPLYVPYENEQIWLTDLEGHADIYDNDSIKINYAPGFDRSQIAKIEVYRNGVKLRFVPALFDVLTNEQMKTFDGYYARRPGDVNVYEQDSPKSDHTDHAIMGYEYSFRLYSSTSASPAKSFAVRVKSGVKWHTDYVYAYIGAQWSHFITYNRLSPGQILAFLQALKAAGFDGISVDYNLFVDSLYANTVVEQLESPEEADIMWIHQVTPTLSQYELVVSSAKQAGLEVELRGHIYPSETWERENPGASAFSGEIAPRNPDAFLDSLLQAMTPVLELSERYGVERTDILTEMDALEKHSDAIERFLGQVASVFSGELGVETAPMHFAGGYNREGTFWDWTDGRRRLAINYSCWNPIMETENDQRLSTMVDQFLYYWGSTHRYFRNTYSEAHVYWGEIGSNPVDGVSRGWDYLGSLAFPEEARHDIQEFNDAFATFLLASAAMGMDGGCLWFAPLCNVTPLNVYCSAILTNTSTMALISSIIGP